MNTRRVVLAEEWQTLTSRARLAAVYSSQSWRTSVRVQDLNVALTYSYGSARIPRCPPPSQVLYAKRSQWWSSQHPVSSVTRCHHSFYHSGGGGPGSIRVRNWNVHCSLEVLHHLNKFTYTCTWTWLYRYWTNLQISRIYVIALLILIFSSSIDLKRVARLRDGERKKVYNLYIFTCKYRWCIQPHL